jgi:hypothetical protein
MKKSIFRSLLAGSVLGLLGTQAMAASDTVLVTGTVLSVLTIAADTSGGGNSFNITPGVAVSNQALATLNINSNSPTGYTVTLTGTHATSVLQDSGTNTIAYTAKYNGGSAQSITTSASTVEDTTSTTAGVVGRALTLDIAAPATVGVPATVGGYTDTITAEILAK